ncbi:SAM-dependent methyltransferase [Ectothiorhodospira haloalkaliphila]|uniref:SAM-dependent methyltransferase n=1 Tax=Ectothiorhodospira haloalkaliphila TaxID=421628 RepID=W8KI98_9GAMM|nr:methyltransferase domain-containing protein [Ectothiorhodospira haloalkaliphila]AHK78908.1 SAM-dependent methyltransferase [Ectothiorhodospira haloalkaliphila]
MNHPRFSARSPQGASTEPPQAGTRVFLNLGCGSAGADRLPSVFRGPQWQQVRIDINPQVKPDIISSIIHLEKVADASVDAIWSSHNLEHLPIHHIPLAMAEMRRVLKPNGFALITLPDLKAVAQLVVEGKLTEVAYQSPAGPVRALDMLFGHAGAVAAGNEHMAHRSGFDAQFLAESLLEAGFAEVRVRKGDCYDLWAYAYMQPQDSDSSGTEGMLMERIG